MVIFMALSLLASLTCLIYSVIDLDHFTNNCERKLRQPNKIGRLAQKTMKDFFRL
ncbi:hypothetical protein VAE308_1050831 [Vibrio aestuarianus]|uniref:Uncharacterized protein n=1 Tax=Vibrio aestuarianus TaxID=28171 RepID=A0ABM9FR83_9VIBR|nr:exported hypothetical protein [Vibrio aestuarianus]CAH8197479.1 hypothetical protein VAE308_1050831 [Vibrio aestuarianus]CAH8217345.1 hypothetical protein VAEKB19_4050008 [Vibrio aestuarianus]CAH8233740.1 hypothetical protein VAE063_950186 [Vibrio aestuarianus]